MAVKASAKALKKALDMSKAARMKRAREMGFDVDRPLYHHTNAPDIEAFRPSERGKLGAGVYFSPSPNYGSRYVDEEGANVIPAFASGKLAKVGDIDKASDLSKAEQSGSDFSVKQWKQRTDEILREQGFSGKEVGDEVLVFDPKNIRSVNAAFDPAKADSPNLLASAAPLAVGAGLLGQSGESEASMPKMLGTATLPTAMEQLQLGNPQPQAEAVPARFPVLHSIANKIDNYQDPTGLLLDTSGTADWLRQFGERGNPYDKLLSAFGAAPF